MIKYNLFLFLFIASIISFIAFIAFYMKAIVGFAMHADEFGGRQKFNEVAEFFGTIFSPGVIISFAVMALMTLTVRILGIVYVAKNKLVSDGEKALWITGFVLMGFVTAIVFLVMAKGKKFVE